MLIPYELDVPFEREPWMNWLLSGSIAIVFGLQAWWWLHTPDDGGLLESPFGPYVLRQFSVKEMVGHLWLHADIIHVTGNLIFLWLFGNAVCQKIGNLLYLPAYLFVGVTAAMAALLFTPHMDRGMVGASGAINGIVGMYVVLYPRNDISVFYWWFLVLRGTFEISGYWMVLLWLAFDVWGAFLGMGNVGYFAHLGGFFTGAGLAMVLLMTRRVVMDAKYEESLLDLIREKFARKSGKQEILNPADIGPEGQSSRLQKRTLSGDEIIPFKTNDSPIPLVPEQGQPPQADVKYIRYACSCGKRFKSHPALAGRMGVCPKCGKQVVIPDRPIR